MCSPKFSEFLVDLKEAILYPDPDNDSYDAWVINKFAIVWKQIDNGSYRDYLEEHGDDRRAITNLLGSLADTDNRLFNKVLVACDASLKS